jgi:hypothetical protein
MTCLGGSKLAGSEIGAGSGSGVDATCGASIVFATGAGSKALGSLHPAKRLKHPIDAVNKKYFMIISFN